MLRVTDSKGQLNGVEGCSVKYADVVKLLRQCWKIYLQGRDNDVGAPDLNLIDAICRGSKDRQLAARPLVISTV